MLFRGYVHNWVNDDNLVSLLARLDNHIVNEHVVEKLKWSNTNKVISIKASYTYECVLTMKSLFLEALENKDTNKGQMLSARQHSMKLVWARTTLAERTYKLFVDVIYEWPKIRNQNSTITPLCSCSKLIVYVLNFLTQWGHAMLMRILTL